MTTQELSTQELFEIFPEAYEIIPELARERSEAFNRENALWEAQYYEREHEKKITYVREKLKNTKEVKVKFEEYFAEVMRNGIRVCIAKGIEKYFLDLWVYGNQKQIERNWLDPLSQEIKRLERIIRKYEWSKNPHPAGSISNEDIARAKDFPITDLVSPNRAGFIKCPFHSESTGSCKIHKDNRYHCYGCGADGDVIDLVCKLFDLTFINAVKKILNK